MGANIRHLIKLIVLFLIFFSKKVSGQDIIFTYPNAAMAFSNPANTGIFGPIHVGSAVRSQYAASAAAGTIYFAEFDMFIKKWNSGFGAYICNDQTISGQLQQTSAALSYVFAFKVMDDLLLRSAIQAIYHNRRRNFQALAFPDMLDIMGNASLENLPYEPYNINTTDFTVGFIGQYRHTEIGLSVHHLGAQVEENHLYNHMKVIIHGKYIIDFQNTGLEEINPRRWLDFENAGLIPYLQYIYQKDFQHLIGGITLPLGKLFVGISLKTALQQEITNMALSAGFTSYGLHVGYTMDFIGWGSGLKSWQGVSHEMFVHFTFGKQDDITAAPYNKGRKKRQSSCFGCYLNKNK